MGEVRHDEDGVVLEEAPRRRRRGPPARRPLTAAERAEAEAKERWRAARAEAKARHLAVLEALVPSLTTPGEARVQSEPTIPIDARTGAGDLRARVVRPNGSELRAVAKHYDGMMGDPPKDYLHLYILFRTGSGDRIRSRGCALQSVEELRAVAKACLEYADEVEANRREGGR